MKYNKLLSALIVAISYKIQEIIMKVKSIEINGIGGIGSLKIDFNERMNFICGPNGIGKTTLLECVAHSLFQ